MPPSALLNGGGWGKLIPNLAMQICDQPLSLIIEVNAIALVDASHFYIPAWSIQGLVCVYYPDIPLIGRCYQVVSPGLEARLL